LKTSPKNQKDKKFTDQNNYHANLSNILVKLVQDIEISNHKKTVPKNLKIVKQMKSKGLLI